MERQIPRQGAGSILGLGRRSRIGHNVLSRIFPPDKETSECHYFVFFYHSCNFDYKMSHSVLFNLTKTLGYWYWSNHITGTVKGTTRIVNHHSNNGADATAVLHPSYFRAVSTMSLFIKIHYHVWLFDIVQRNHKTMSEIFRGRKNIRTTVLTLDSKCLYRS